LLVAQFKRGASGALNADVCGNTGQDNRGELAAAQVQVQIGAVKGAPLALGDDIFCSLFPFKTVKKEIDRVAWCNRFSSRESIFEGEYSVFLCDVWCGLSF
jgi:hypothetical protein